MMLPHKKIRLLIICGTLETGMRPVPPVADGAPEWNVFRLAEAAFANPDCSLDIQIVSPCEETQMQALHDFPAKAIGSYHHIVLSRFLLALSRKYSRFVRLLLRRFLKLPDLISWLYLRRALRLVDALKPDLVIINDRPQYVAYLKKRVAKAGLWLMLRYPIGESRRFLGLLDGMIVNSQGMGNYIGQFIHPGQPAVWQIPNTLGEEFLVPKTSTDRFLAAEKLVLFVGRLIPEKGARELLLAFQRVYVQMPGVKLVICGVGGDIKYVQSLHLLAVQLPSGTVVFSGQIPYHQLGEYYASASVAVFPSLPEIYVESFGMVALEAMRCGTPVVAARQPGFEEQILHGETGLLVDDPRDAEALARAILQILQDPDLAQRMGQAGYQRSLAYTPQNGLLALEKIIHASKRGLT